MEYETVKSSQWTPTHTDGVCVIIWWLSPFRSLQITWYLPMNKEKSVHTAQTIGEGAKYIRWQYALGIHSMYATSSLSWPASSSSSFSFLDSGVLYSCMMSLGALMTLMRKINASCCTFHNYKCGKEISALERKPTHIEIYIKSYLKLNIISCAPCFVWRSLHSAKR